MDQQATLAKRPSYTINVIETNHATGGLALIPTVIKKLEKILQSDYEPGRCREKACNPMDNPYVPLKRTMQKFQSKVVDGHLQVVYKRRSGDTTSNKGDPRDRAYAEMSISAGSMKREVRAAMYHGSLKDFDQCSAHQSLILSALLADPDQPPCKWLQHYVDNKSAVRKEIADDHFGGDKQQSKQLFQKIMFGGRTSIGHPCVKGMIWELKHFETKVVEANPHLHAAIKRRTKAKNAAEVKKAMQRLGLSKDEAEQRYGHKRWEASLASLWCRNKEPEVVEAVLGWAIKAGLVHNRRFDNSFDGLMIPVEDVDMFLQTDSMHSTVEDLMRTFNQVGRDETGYNVKWEEKDMQPEHDKYWQEYEAFEKEHQKEYPDYFDIEIYRTLTSVQQRKEYFFNCFYYIENQHKALTFQRIHVTRSDGTTDSEPVLLWCGTGELISTYGHLPSGLLDDKGRDIPIAVVWLKSEDRAQFAKTDAIPYAGVYDKERSKINNTLNIFSGYPRAIWENASDCEIPVPVMWERIRPFIALTSHLAGAKCYNEQGRFPPTLDEYPEADRMQVELMLFFMGHRITHPGDPRLPYYLCIQSECGTGKNTWLEPLRSLVGANHYKCSSDMETYCGAHSEGLMSKIIAVLNEADISSTAKVTNRFKEFVTEDHQTGNVKFMRPFEYAIWAAIIVLTNNKVPMRIEPMNRERRVILFESNTFTARKWGNEVWSFLHNHFRSVEFLRALRQFFTTRDYKSFDFRKARAANLKLPAYTQLAMHFTPVEVMFVRNYIETGQFSMNRIAEENPRFWTINGWDSNVTVKAKDFYEMSKVYYKEANLTSAATERSFYAFNQKMEVLSGIDKVMVDRVVHFRLNPCMVYRDLLAKCLVDPDAVEPELLADLENEAVDTKDDFLSVDQAF